MKKRRLIIITAVAHTILWIAFLPISIIGRLTFRGDPGMEPLELLMSKGIYNFLIIIAVAGIFNSELLVFSLRSVLAAAITKSKVLEKVALAFSIASNILFYLFAILVFLINTDAIFTIPIMWVLCAACSCVFLNYSGNKEE